MWSIPGDLWSVAVCASTTSISQCALTAVLNSARSLAAQWAERAPRSVHCSAGRLSRRSRHSAHGAEKRATHWKPAVSGTTLALPKEEIRQKSLCPSSRYPSVILPQPLPWSSPDPCLSAQSLCACLQVSCPRPCVSCASIYVSQSDQGPEKLGWVWRAFIGRHGALTLMR